MYSTGNPLEGTSYIHQQHSFVTMDNKTKLILLTGPVFGLVWFNLRKLRIEEKAKDKEAKK